MEKHLWNSCHRTLSKVNIPNLPGLPDLLLSTLLTQIGDLGTNLGDDTPWWLIR